MTNPIVKSMFPMNPEVFTEEVAAAGLSVEMTHFNGDEDAGDFLFYFDSDPTSGDETLFDGVCSSHDPRAFDLPPFKDINEAGDSDDSGDEVVTVHLDDIMPAPGDYSLWAYQELATTTTDGTHIAKGRLQVTKNGSKVERGEDHNDQHIFKGMFVGFPFTVKAGDVYTFELTYERQGAGTGNPARFQRARISIKRDET